MARATAPLISNSYFLEKWCGCGRGQREDTYPKHLPRLLRLGAERRGERSKATDDEGPSADHPKCRISASAFSSQYVMPISRYIVKAVARLS